MFGRWISIFTWITFVSWIKNIYIKPYYWEKMNMPKFSELMRTENKIKIRNVSMFILIFKKKKKTTPLYLVLAFFLYIHVVDLLIFSYIYNEGSWLVDISLYLCIMNVYMFVYWLYTKRYSVINSWNSCIYGCSYYITKRITTLIIINRMYILVRVHKYEYIPSSFWNYFPCISFIRMYSMGI